MDGCVTAILIRNINTKRPTDNKKEQRTQHATQKQFVSCGGRNRPSSIYWSDKRFSGSNLAFDEAVATIPASYRCNKTLFFTPKISYLFDLLFVRVSGLSSSSTTRNIKEPNFYEKVNINFTGFIRFVKRLVGDLMV